MVTTGLHFTTNDLGQLVMTFPDGKVHSGVEPVRCFPLTDPGGLIALLDANGAELLNLPNLDVLPASEREVLQRELTSREFIPVIHRIVLANPPSPPCRWDVETDRGKTSFQLESEDDVRRMGSGAIIADSHGIRYKIIDIDQLDSHSQRIVHRVV